MGIKVSVVYVGPTCIKAFKRRLAWDTDKQFQFISSIMSFKIIIHATEELKNKADLSL